MTSATAFSGIRYDLDGGRTRARIGSVAAVLRSLVVDGVAVTEEVPDGSVPPQGCGMVLAPWPNRVRRGVWRWEGEEQRLAVTDASWNAASHGLLRNTAYRLLDSAQDAVELAATVAPQPGWPFLLDTRVRYRVTGDGLEVTHSVENLSGRRAPWAVGAHPYFRVGSTPIEQLELTVPATLVQRLDDGLIPVATEPVEGTADDLRHGRLVGDLDLNAPFGGIDSPTDADGTRELARLTAPDGASTTLWGDAAFRWLQLYTPRDHPRTAADGRVEKGLAVAIEPMTAPPDALNSGTDLIILEPGESWSGRWGVRYRAAVGR